MKSPYQEPEKDAVIIGESKFPTYIPESKVTKFLFGESGGDKSSNELLNALASQNLEEFQALNVNDPRSHDMAMHDQSMDHQDDEQHESNKMKFENDFFTLIKNEMPELKFTKIPITKEDIKNMNTDMQVDSEEQVSTKTIPNGFFDILGLSRRHIER